ncbi:MAG TPA: hypothetical protein VF533_11375 [Solirubrobacteraceae bacterium]
MIGRAYMASGEDLAMVVFDETIMASDLDVNRQSSAQAFVDRIEGSLQYTAEWSTTIRERFGGHPFTADDAMLMAF